MMRLLPTKMSDKLRRGGFTLVELMVAVALMGLVMSVVYALFATTSDSLYEADSLADTLDRTRFAIEQVSADVQSAGSFGTPDSETDPWVQPKRSNKYRLVAVAPYANWQNQTPYSDPVVAAHDEDDDGTPDISFDGFILLGAIDFPQNFEVAQLTFDNNMVDTNNDGTEDSQGDSFGRVSGGVIPATERGLFKLLVNDPFYTETGQPTWLSLTNDSQLLTQNLHNRLIRVMDRHGYVQVSGIKPGAEFSTGAAASAVGGGGVAFELTIPWLVQNNSSDAASEDAQYGLERKTVDDEDIGYDAALLDAYWYHVERDPEDPTNYRLVRERLNAQGVIEAMASDIDGITLNQLTGNLAAQKVADDGTVTNQRQKVVITDRVVDFQFWVDCADDDGNVIGATWQMEWSNPGGGGCMSQSTDGEGNTTPPEPGRARMAHIRLSVRTAHERRDQQHSPATMFIGPDGSSDANRPLQTFDVVPDAVGAARVVTVQSDVELTNAAMRNVDYTQGGS